MPAYCRGLGGPPRPSPPGPAGARAAALHKPGNRAGPQTQASTRWVGGRPDTSGLVPGPVHDQTPRRRHAVMRTHHGSLNRCGFATPVPDEELPGDTERPADARGRWIRGRRPPEPRLGDAPDVSLRARFHVWRMTREVVVLSLVGSAWRLLCWRRPPSSHGMRLRAGGFSGGCTSVWVTVL